MSPTELREHLEKVGLSQRGAARALDLSERTMRYYCAGETPIPRVVEYALRWLAQQERVES
jgi:plasmid maintenance system antidote protein VapI